MVSFDFYKKMSNFPSLEIRQTSRFVLKSNFTEVPMIIDIATEIALQILFRAGHLV